MPTLLVPDMSCDHCKATVEKTVRSIDPAATLAFDMDARTVALTTSASLATLQAALQTAGYPATDI